MEDNALYDHDIEHDDWEASTVFDVDTDDWTTVDFYAIVKARKKVGLTDKTYNDAAKTMDNYIKGLMPFNEQSYYKDIDSMDFGVPRNEHDIRKLEIRYSEYASYLPRLNEMAKIVRHHVQVFEQAYKTLKVMAMKLSGGTIRDKEAQAEYMVQAYLGGYMKAKRVYDYIDDCRKAVDNSSTTLNRILKERENERFRTSGVYVKEGQALKFEALMNEENAEKEDPRTPAKSHVRKRSNNWDDD